jgi:hypothetical protein
VRLAVRRIALITMHGALAAACSFVADLGPPKLAPDDGGIRPDAGIGSDGGPGGDRNIGDGIDAPDQWPPGVPDARGDTSDESAPDSDADSGVQGSFVAVGPTHACAIVQSGPGSPENNTVRCWGSNGSGELGSDSTQIRSSSTPLRVSGLVSGARDLALTNGYSFAVTLDNFVYAWGNVPADPNNPRIQREPATHPYQPSLIDLGGSHLGPVTTASVGANGACCTLTDRSLVCWGAFAQTSVAEAGAADAAVVVLEGGTVTVSDFFDSVVVGRAHACGTATRNGVRDVECWGANDHGQSGMPVGSRVNSPTPVGLASMGAIQELAAGRDNSCALLTDGNVYCWGANDYGQLGDAVDGARDVFTPTRVNLGRPASHIAVGDVHACALLDTAEVWCWGDNSAAQLGAGNAGGSNPRPASVQRPQGPGGKKPLQYVQQIAAGGRTTCIRAIGNPRVLCWGANDFGQAGQTPASPFIGYATEVAW